jgi:hypothetical protein
VATGAGDGGGASVALASDAGPMTKALAANAATKHRMVARFIGPPDN